MVGKWIRRYQLWWQFKEIIGLYVVFLTNPMPLTKYYYLRSSNQIHNEKLFESDLYSHRYGNHYLPIGFLYTRVAFPIQVVYTTGNAVPGARLCVVLRPTLSQHQ